MRSTCSFGIARLSGRRAPRCFADRATNEFKRLSWLPAVACCALALVALAGCGSVQVTSASGSAPAGTSGGVSGANAQPPVVNGAPATSAQVGVLYDYTPNVSDALGRALSFNITNMPAWASFNTATGELTGTPAADDVGRTAEIQIVVSDGAGLATIGPFRITITAAQSSPPPAEAPPAISGAPAASVAAGQPYLFVPTASDPNGHTLSFSIVNRPSWANFSTTTGELSGIPTASNVGSFANIMISVSNGTATVSLPVFTLTVTALPAAGSPTINGTPATSANVGAAYSFTPTANDPNGLALTFSVQNQPAWANFNKDTGELSGTPAAADVGSFANIVITISDGTATASLAAFTITVLASTGDGPPTISGTPTPSAIVASAYSFTPTASDPQGRALTFSIQNQPSWANFNKGTGQLSGTPAAANVGSFANIVITVSDGTASASLPVFTVTVSAQSSDRPPTIRGTPATAVTAGTAYSFTPTATDSQGHALTFSIQNQPSWATFHATTGQLAGTPSAANVGSFANIKISVSNGTSSASLAAFTITVSAQSVGPPTISGTPATSINVGSAYSFTPTAADPQGHALTFTISNRPAWASFNTNTGQLSGTPNAGNVRTFANITISVSNGTSSAALPAFTITVTQPVDGPPTISGTPATSVNVGSVYSFTPTATDPQGHTLTFSIQNQPSWTNFNKNTGQLSGTPGAANVGTFANITISASNGNASASLPAFSINVTEVSTGTADLDWTIPTQNTNGTPLVNLAGYRIYYGTSSSNLNQTVQINDPSVNTYMLNGLAPGTWYFATVDYTSDGTESSFSNIASKTIQ
jgi:hypothetical protein